MDDQQFDDLSKVATERAVKALDSVTQLMDSRYAYATANIVAVTLVQIAARHLNDSAEQLNGHRPPDAAALVHVIGNILDAVGVRWEERDEARQ